ncbi:MAG: hypothetical protein EOP50_21560 [Sphingobacteriales bacterium]|nr:MAG: hypothetical protein EOP50_21560 [Sphingobacteriales bacterium]
MRIELSGDEALVLFECLSRFKENGSLSIANQAEERAFWNIAALLEKQLVEPFSENYIELVAQARERLRDKDE